MITTEIYEIPWGQELLVYAPLRKVAFLTNSATFKTIMQLKEGAFDTLTNEQAELVDFLESVGITDKSKDHEITDLYQHDYEPIEVTLFLTSECNLRCNYCYARAGDTPSVRMSLETAKRGIDHIIRNAIKQDSRWFGVYFHGGGEPTLNQEVLTGSWAYANSLATDNNLQLYSSVTTNGVISPQIRRWIINNLQSATVSLDGPPHINDINRPNRAGFGSSKRVLETLKEFDEANFRYGIRVTVSAYSIKEIPNIINYLVENTKPYAIKVEPVYNLGRGKDESLHVEASAFVEGFENGKKVAEKEGIRLLYSSARLNLISSRFCRAYGEGFTLTPNGEVTGCFEVADRSADFADKMIFGKYDQNEDKFIFDNNLLIPLREHSVSKQAYCSDCFAKWHCSGDCPNKVQHSMVNGQFQGMPSCDITRHILRNEIIEAIEKSGGIVWIG